MWNDAPEGQCFLADGSGHKITGDDFETDINGEDTMVPWTIKLHGCLGAKMAVQSAHLLCEHDSWQWLKIYTHESKHYLRK